MYAFAIWVTTGCNLECSYCYEGKKKETISLNVQNADRIVEFIKKTSESTKETIIIDFHGGEPLLNYSIIKYIIECLKKTGNKYIYGITTNGTIYSKEIREFLINNFSYSLTVSLDGTKEVHNNNRKFKNGNPTYDIALKTALDLLEKRPDIRIRMTVVPNNIRELSKGVITLIEYGFKIIVPALDYFDSNWTQYDMDILKNELKKLKVYISKFNGDTDIKIGMLNCRKQKLNKCSGGIYTFHIVPNGDIYPCAYSVGVKEEKIGNAISGLDTQKIEILKSIYESQNEKCSGCDNYEFCISSRCKILNQKVMGSYNEPIPVICAEENAKRKL